MATPKFDLSQFPKQFVSDGTNKSLVVKHDNQQLAPWRIVFASSGTFVLNFATKDHPGDPAGVQASLDVIVGMVIFSPAIEIAAATTPGLKLICEY